MNKYRLTSSLPPASSSSTRGNIEVEHPQPDQDANQDANHPRTTPGRSVATAATLTQLDLSRMPWPELPSKSSQVSHVRRFAACPWKWMAHPRWLLISALVSKPVQVSPWCCCVHSPRVAERLSLKSSRVDEYEKPMRLFRPSPAWAVLL